MRPHPRFDLAAILLSSLAIAAGCAGEPGGGGETSGRASQAVLGSCGLGDEVLAWETLTPVVIPALSALERAQIVAAVQESSHTDVTTVEEAFDRVDGHEINRIVRRDAWTNQFYLKVEYGAGDNSYGAIFYWGTAHKAAAIHDGFEEECGPLTFNYDHGDTAPACAGLLTYANTASLAALDAYLPSNVAQAIVDARTVAPFGSVASVIAVHGVAEVRLQQLLAAARTAGLVGATCDGIHDQIAVSAAEAAAMVALVNEASADELHGVLAFLINHGVVANLIAGRPVATAGDLALISGVGPAVFRALRNAATIRGPWDELVDAVNEIDHPDGQIRLDTHFDWVPYVTGAADFSSMTCFGIDASLLPAGATVRPALATGAEVMAEVGAAVATANYLSELSIDPAPGLADLAWRTAGRAFRGCYISFHPSPWVYDDQRFFVDTDRGAGVLITSHYVE
jgi:DNA uptake protein ComE-like DNA-binding protein